MFVRWKTKAIRGARWCWQTSKKDVGHYAYLVESKRVDGKPKSRTICYIGCVRDSEINTTSGQNMFWGWAHHRLVEAGLTEAEIIAIELKLAEKVHRPTEEEKQEDKKRSAEEIALARAKIASYR